MFAISDAVAWLVGIASLASAVAYPFVGPIHARMVDDPLTAGRIFWTVVIALAVALGAYLLRRRRAVGLLLLLLPCVEWPFSRAPHAGLWYGLSVVFVFGSPMALAFVEAQQQTK